MHHLKLSLLALPILFSNAAFGTCAPGDFVSSSDKQVTITTRGSDYSPRCLKVKPGTTVTIQASERHPLQGIEMGPPNPFLRGSPGTRPETHTLNAPGSYGYFCTDHGDKEGNGMAGVVVVE